MAATIDERIVAAKFDASDFEKGVNKTIKKLDELKESLNLKDTAKSIKETADKTEESTKSMSSSLEKLTERFTTFTGMIKQKLLSGLADEVANVFLRMEQSVKSFIKSISSDQIGAGLDKYQQMLTSVRVMVSNGVSESEAYGALEQLSSYSDQTSYSITQMTDALSKMVSAGLEGKDGLETATQAVQGIANACANAGINAQDAQRAFYNLSQAYGKGKLEYTDYKSLELLNMTTASFKENLLEAAVEVGTLKKVSEGVYKTSNKVDKKVQANKKVTDKNLTDMLKYDFVNTSVLNTFFKKYYFSEKEMDKIYDELGTDKYHASEEQREEALKIAKKQFGDLAVQAYMAAREARSFTDVINTLKDAVSTGWSNTFEYLFGKLDQAKDFFTELTEGKLAEVVYMIGEYRNAILGFWDNGIGDMGGGKVFRDTILHITDALGVFLKTFLQILPGFDELGEDEESNQKILKALGSKLFDLSLQLREVSKNIKQAADDFNAFMNSKIGKDGPTRIELIRSALSNLGSVFGILGKAISFVFSTVHKTFYELSPVFDGILVFIDKVTSPLKDLNNDSSVFKDLEYSAENLLTILAPIANVLGSIIGFLGDIGAFIASLAIGTVTENISFISDLIGLLLELFGIESAQQKDTERLGVLEQLKADLQGIIDVGNEALNTLKSFFGALIEDLRKLFGLTSEEENKNGDGGIFSNLKNFFETNQFIQDAKAWVNQAIIDVGDFIKSIPSRIKQLGASIYDTLWHLFFYEKTEYVGSQLETKTYKTELGEWLDGVINDVKNFIIDLPNKVVSAIGTIGNWINTIFNTIFGYTYTEKQKVDTDEKGNSSYVEVEKRFDGFIDTVVKNIKEWFNDLPKKIEEGFKGIGNFFEKVWNTIDEFLFGKKVNKVVKEVDEKGNMIRLKKITVRYKTGFSKWLDGVIKDIKKFIKNIPAYIKAGIKGAGDIISSIVNAIFGKDPNEKQMDKNDVQEELEKPFLGINLTNIINEIKSIGKEIFNQIARIFTGSEEYETNAEWFSNIVAEGIKWIREKAETALQWVLNFITTLPEKISSIFSDENKNANNVEGSTIGKEIIKFGEMIGNFLIYELPKAALSIINSAVNFFDGVWNKIYESIVGDTKKTSEEISKVMYPNAMAGDPRFTVKSPWEQFVEKLGKTIGNAFEKLPTWIAEGIHIALNGLNNVFSSIIDWLNGENTAKEIQAAAEKAQKEAEKSTTKAAEGITKGTEEAAKKVENEEDENPLFTAIKGIGQSLYNLIVTTIPGFLSAAWTWLGSAASSIWDGISSIFAGEPTTEEKEATSEAAKSGIQNFLKTTLPNKISEIWGNLKQFGIDIWNGVTSIFTGEIPESERALAIANIGNAIKDVIMSAINGISSLFNKEDPVEKALKNANLTDGDAAYFKRYADKMKKDSKKANEDVGNSFLSSLLGSFETIGPAILTGLSSALDFIGDIAGMLIKALTGEKSLGDQITEAYSDEKPEVRSAFQKIGESLKKFFMETIPQLIGSALGALASNAGTWFGNFFDAMHKAEEDEAKKASMDGGGGGAHTFGDSLESVDGALGIVKNIFNELRTWVGENKDFIEIAVIIIALTHMLRNLSNLFSVSDDLDAAANTVKWTAITLAVVAISGIFAAIQDVINSGDDKKITAMHETIDKLGNMFLALAGVMSMLAVAKWGDAFSERWENGVTQKVGLGEKILGGLTDAVTGFFEAVGIGAGAYVGTSLAGAGVNNLLTSISDAFTTLSSGMDDALSMIMPFVNTLNEMDSKLETAKSAAYKIKDLFGIFFNVLSELFMEIYGYTMDERYDSAGVSEYVLKNSEGKIIKTGATKELLSLSGFLDELSQRMNIFLQMSAFIDQIASSVEKISSISDFEGKIDEMSAVFTNGKFGEFMKNLLNLLNTAIKDSDISPEKLGTTSYIMERNSGMALALDLLASSLSVFANGIADFDESSVDSLDKTLGVFSKLYESLGDVKVENNSLFKAFLGDNSLSKVGQEIKLFAVSMKAFYDNIKDIPGFESEGSTKKVNRKIDSIASIALQFGRVIDDLSNSNSFAVELISDMGEKLPEFGTKVAEFFVNLDNAMETITPERADTLYTAANTMAAVMSSIRDLSAVLEFATTKDNLSDILDKLFTGMGDDINSRKLASLVQVFDKGVSEAMKRPEFGEGYKEIGSGLAAKLVEGIQAAFDEDETLRPTLTIIPVIDDGKLREQLKMTFGNESFDTTWLAQNVEGSNNQVDEDRVTNTSLTALINGIKGDDTISLKSIIDSQVTASDLTRAFAGMQITIDKSTLIGEIVDGIDEAIGNKIMQIVRGLAMGPSG